MNKIGLLSLVLAASLASNVSFAAKKTKTTKTTTTTTTTDSASGNQDTTRSYQPTHYASTNSDVGQLRWSVSGPLAIISGDAYIGANVQAMSRLNNDFSVGGESGFMFHSATGASVWMIPLMARGMYHFHMHDAGSFAPYLTASMGIDFVHVSLDTAFLGQSASDTSVKFAALFGVGAFFNSTEQFFGEIRVGTIASSFAFVPSVGWKF